jgi:hypothetical protein
MGVSIIDTSLLPWQEVPVTWNRTSTPGDPVVRFKPFALPAPEVPTGQIIEYEPGHSEGEHTHEEAELYFVLAGDLTILNHAAGPGAIVHISARTRYSNRTSGGCTFLRLGLGVAAPAG